MAFMVVKSMFGLSLTHLKLLGHMECIHVSSISLLVSIFVIICIVLRAMLCQSISFDLPSDLSLLRWITSMKPKLSIQVRNTLITSSYGPPNQILDVQPNNILLGIDDESILTEMEEDEISNPAPRKQLCDRTIYATRAMPLTSGEPNLADLGEARFAKEKQTGLIMPSVYRAPEVMLGMNWDNKVDIWAMGQMVSGPTGCSDIY